MDRAKNRHAFYGYATTRDGPRGKGSANAKHWFGGITAVWLAVAYALDV